MQSDDVSSRGGVDRVIEELSVCPSFSTYYSDRQATAARAVYDVLASSSYQTRSELDEDEFGFATGRFENSDCVVNEDEEFEFSKLYNENEIGQIFPLFDRNLIGEAAEAKVDVAASVSLKKLFLQEDREDQAESESEADDELESVEPGTYCVWRPTKTPPSQSPSLSPTRCNKSKSTGSCSKRWKLRDLLLRRSNSDGKDSFVYITPSSKTTSSSIPSNSNLNSEDAKSLKSKSRASSHELFYVEKRTEKEEDKRRSYLPYRNGLLGFGFFPNANVLYVS